MEAPVWHYDGVTAARRIGALEVMGGGFSLIIDGQAGERVSWSDLVHRGLRGGLPYYGLKQQPGWQIGFTSGVADEIAMHLPRAQTYGGWIDRIGLAPATVGFLVISALLIFVGIKVPEAVAPAIPLSWEKKLGAAMIGDMGGRLCNGPGGQAALDRLVERIDGKSRDIDVRVANIGIVNAVALPGGKIVIFRGLLQQAKSGDEIAGVIGHEIGHVRHRDVMQALLRQAGLSVLMGGVDGNAGGALNAMVSATYSRDAESAADNYAIRSLGKAAVDPSDTAGFFTRMAKDGSKLGEARAALGYLSSHPLSESRERAFLKSKSAGVAYAPVLSRDQWNALADICHNDPKVAKDNGLFF